MRGIEIDEDGLTLEDFGFAEPKPSREISMPAYFDDDTLRTLGLDPDAPQHKDVVAARTLLKYIEDVGSSYISAEEWVEALCECFPNADRDRLLEELEAFYTIQSDLREVRRLVAACQHPDFDEDLDLFPDNPPPSFDEYDFEDFDDWVESVQDREEASWTATTTQAIQSQNKQATTRASETAAAFSQKSGARGDGESDDSSNADADADNRTTNSHKTRKSRKNNKKYQSDEALAVQKSARIYHSGTIHILEAANALTHQADPDPDDKILPDPYRVDGEDDGVYRYLRKAVLAHRKNNDLTPRQKSVANTYLLLAVPHMIDVLLAHFRRCGINHAHGFVDDAVAALIQILSEKHDFARSRNVNIKLFLTSYIRDVHSLVRFCDSNDAFGATNPLSHVVQVSGFGDENDDMSVDDALGYVHHHFCEDGKPRDLADDWVEREDLAYRLYYDGEETMPLDDVLILVERNIDWGHITPENRERIRQALREVTGFCEQRIINSLVARANPQRERDRKIFAPVQDVSRKLLENVFQMQMQLFEGACA
ncbi:hypothetical protein [Acidithiobacillus caldus]|uniref:hypothetical protein n=1 Tax=Acidithiobacillus caldus TaxID=33059 RepID=UPI0007F4E902|nr:hypothetical protein [Acidithiobacillus caldus]QER43208.1 hypothetical protein F0726_00116 [Acidithiobacillus caldus]